MRIGTENIDLRNNDWHDNYYRKVPKALKTFKYFKQQQFAVSILFEYLRWLGERRNFEDARARGKKLKKSSLRTHYLTIIPWAQMGSESIAQEAEGQMGYWLRGHEVERNNCFSKIQLAGQKYRDKTTLAS